MLTGKRRFHLEQFGDVTIAKFVDTRILDEVNIQEIGDHMFGLIDEQGRRKIILDFSQVEYLSSAVLGKLVTLEKKAKMVHAKLRLCCIRPEIYEAFVLVHFDKTFDIKSTQDEALEGF